MVGDGPKAVVSGISSEDGECIVHYNHFTMCCTVPSGSPLNFTNSTTSRTLTLSWSPPLPSQRNGVIVNYLITCSSGGSIINSTRTSSTILTITGLQPFTDYFCLVRAATIAGDGPATVMHVLTKEESELHLTNNNFHNPMIY